MKLLVLNPNTTRKVTDRVAQAARTAASPGTEIVSAIGTNSIAPVFPLFFLKIFLRAPIS